MPAPAQAFRFDPEWRITLFTLVMVPLMAGLGYWQLQRAGDKASLAAAWDQRQQRPPAPLDSLWEAAPESLAYAPTEFSGSFLADEYLLLDNRVQNGRFGYEVLGIVRLEDSDRVVLVNRGWVAGDPARVELPAVPEVPGRVTVSGHVYVAPGRPFLLGEQVLAAGWPKRLQAVEMDKLREPLEAIAGGAMFPYPVRIDANSPGALSVHWQVMNTSPQKHQGYAVQWFAMALALAIFYLLRSSNAWQFFKNARRKRR